MTPLGAMPMGPMGVMPLPGKGKKQKKAKMTPYEKQLQKELKAAGTRKQQEQQKGVQSFDSFYGEAGRFNEVPSDLEQADSMEQGHFYDYGGRDHGYEESDDHDLNEF